MQDTTVGRVGRALLAACFLPLIGCDEGGRQGLLAFEVAAPTELGCSPPNADFDESAPCTVVRLYRRDGASLVPVPLFRAEDDHSASAPGALELRFDGRDIRFDARLPREDDLHDLQITVYAGDPWAPAFGARIEQVRFDQGTIPVRLYPLRQWSCPGRVDDGDGTLEPRALHAAVRVDNGDVLLLGGVTGSPVSPRSAGDREMGALLQPIVEVFDADENVFRRVTVDRPEGFGRVLFGAYYVGAQGTRHRIRAVGGLELPPDDAGSVVLGLDNSGLLTPLGAVLAPSGRARAAGVVDLIYDAEQHTMEIQAPSGDPLAGTPGAWIEVSSPLPDMSRAILMGLAGGDPWPPSPDYFVTGGGSGLALAQPRLGAAIEALPAVDRYLVWGGNLGATAVADTAGEILAPGSASVPISSSAAGLPAPVAFHTATRVADDAVLITGGLVVDPSGGVTDNPPSDPLFALQVFDASTVVLREVDDGDYVPSILHTATPVPGWGVVIVGGATLSPSGDRLTPTASVGRVHGVVGTFAYDGSLDDLSEARFGHAAALLPGNRLLVTGGFASGNGGLTTLSDAEVMLLADAPVASIPEDMCVDQSGLSDAGIDAGVRIDAGRSPPPRDAGGGDAGAMIDAGPDGG